MVNLLTGMSRLGAEVDLLLPPGEHPDLAQTDARFATFALDPAGRATGAEQLRRYLTERRPYSILSNKDETNALLARSTERGARPFTVFRVGTNVLEKLRRGGRLVAPWRRRRLAATYREADALIGISAGGAEALRRLIGQRGVPPIYHIWNPVDLAGVRRLAQQVAGHPWLGEKRGPLIVSVGRLVSAKDYTTLIRAFGLVRPELDCHLLILGEGKQRDRLLSLGRSLGIADDFELPGFRSNPFPYVHRADLFVVSSLFEGANNALMEAQALGTPCVSTDCPSGPREILADGRYGRLVPVGDARFLAQAMLETLRRPPDRTALARAAERFDLLASCRRYLNVLRIPAPREGRPTPR